MNSYTLEQSAERINHHKTREYFRDVIQSYTNGSYRSAVVMLYSVVISDLVYKLKELKDLYDDSNAIDILNKVEQKQISNPESGEWEKFLITQIEKRTFLLEPIDKSNLLYLREQRHLSAHPVLTNEDLLSTPNQETVRSLMKNMLEGILTKGAVMTTKVLPVLLNDLANSKDSFLDEKGIEKFLTSRYFKHINDNLIKEIFKSLWDITFRCQSEECKEHRGINYQALKIIYKNHQALMKKNIRNELSYYGRFDINDLNILERLFALFGYYPEIYSIFEEHTKDIIEDKAKSIWTLRIKTPFLKENMTAHLSSLLDDLNNGSYKSYSITKPDEILLFKWAREEGCEEIFYNLLIKYFTSSVNFDQAFENYRKYIEPNLSDFNKTNFESLYQGLNRNRQCRDHKHARRHILEIKTFSDKVFTEDYDYSHKYPNVDFE